VIGRGQRDGVDIVACDQVAKIRIRRTVLVAIDVVDAPLGAFPVVLVHVVHGHHLATRITQEAAQVAVALAAHADRADGDPIAGGRTPVRAAGRGRNDGRKAEDRPGGSRALEKAAATQSLSESHQTVLLVWGLVGA